MVSTPQIYWPLRSTQSPPLAPQPATPLMIWPLISCQYGPTKRPLYAPKTINAQPRLSIIWHYQIITENQVSPRLPDFHLEIRSQTSNFSLTADTVVEYIIQFNNNKRTHVCKRIMRFCLIMLCSIIMVRQLST